MPGNAKMNGTFNYRQKGLIELLHDCLKIINYTRHQVKPFQLKVSSSSRSELKVPSFTGIENDYIT